MDSKNLKIVTKTYKWDEENRNYVIESLAREDKKYQLKCVISDNITKETYSISKTPWQELEKRIDPVILGIVNYVEDTRKIYKIFFDLHIQFPNEYIIDSVHSPLFARFYTTTHNTNYDEDWTTFEYDDEIWLTCDNDMNISIINYYMKTNEEMDLVVHQVLENYENYDDQLIRIKEQSKSVDKIDAKIYKWAFKKIKKFYHDTFGREIDETIKILPKTLLNIILMYII